MFILIYDIFSILSIKKYLMKKYQFLGRRYGITQTGEIVNEIRNYV